ncbi:hypothetical protein FOQG_13204 [Fusarium oxysporum f. sp. raphani 54005]|uniref:Uncharacterized protein n=4 Tax=Fusarium oxysporum TaxID=5507 RepID=X0BU77_FUSOX|nr:hypothetical protein FOVG_12836 [Fusarium oxysporum f. sp. pisi HDV247]EXK82493.1 hypothetical protein FOQG_13204 [Fusarium oxysporum f. sp. raphani 54005]EXL68428.1 hypothetical protein FOPG_15513 [Fusarium oxysporum f. sp. conglutinans race 2 54008]KAG7000096.1 hypothetical protein FocnCong_v012200 [Fusarium oxysporum f. sp. conglutinans]KAG7425728.1 hypothetical protein Forpi1262_v013162 [Fusarium oxysporum f. sp. raphani]KAI8405946.1 hypothetical protein FOFC_13408 [Fusarium oxysporum]
MKDSSEDQKAPIESSQQDAPEVEVIDGGRPTIRTFTTTAKLRPNDMVRVLSNGSTYTVSEVRGGKYILCDDSGKEVMQGREYDESELELVDDPF